MPTIQIEADVSTKQLLELVQQLPTDQFDTFFAQVLAIHAQRATPHLGDQESQLLVKINQGIPADVQTRFNALVTKRNQNTLSETEYQELLRLSDDIEKLDAERVAALGTLAAIRNVSLTELMQSLGINMANYA